jgi:hypothetical protein
MRVANRALGMQIWFESRTPGVVMMMDLDGVFQGGRDMFRGVAPRLPRLRHVKVAFPDIPSRASPTPRVLFVFDKADRRGWMDGRKRLEMGTEVGGRSEEELEIERVLVEMRAEDLRGDSDDVEWVVRTCVEGEEGGARVGHDC